MLISNSLYHNTYSLFRRQMSTSSKLSSPFIVIDAFCLRQFSSSGKAAEITTSVDEVVERVNAAYETEKRLIDGYAPFCKHMFIPNWTELAASTVPINDANRHHLVSEYSARTAKELAVLIRYFPRGAVEQPRAKFLDIILYSREQVDKENAAMSAYPSSSSAPTAEVSPAYTTKSTECAWQWAIVSIKAQSEAFETPMTPMTMMRNALGISEGGSGTPLSRSEYEKSVDFWAKHAAVQ